MTHVRLAYHKTPILKLGNQNSYLWDDWDKDLYGIQKNHSEVLLHMCLFVFYIWALRKFHVVLELAAIIEWICYNFPYKNVSSSLSLFASHYSAESRLRIKKHYHEKKNNNNKSNEHDEGQLSMFVKNTHKIISRVETDHDTKWLNISFNDVKQRQITS